MTSKELKDIVDFIKKDPEAQERINSIFSNLPEIFGEAGTIRNHLFNIGQHWTEVFAQGSEELRIKYPELGIKPADYAIDLHVYIEKHVCTGIARITSEIIQREIKNGNPLFKNLEKVEDGEWKGGEPHHGTVFTEKNGNVFVLDYHKTLDTDNPMFYKSREDWDKSRNGQTYEDYIEKNPVTNPNGEETNQNGVNVGPLASAKSGAPASANVFTRIHELLAEINASIQQLDANLKVS